MRGVRAVLLGGLLSACSSGGSESATAVAAATNNLGPTRTQFPEDQSVCPSTVESAVGADCDVEGEVCSPQYACGIAPGQATCTCAAGHFSCQDQLGASLRPDAAPGCPAPLPIPTCPDSMGLANNTACAQAGEICTYPSPCVSIPAYLDCQCVPLPQIDGGVYLGYECTNPCTPGSSSVGPVDASTTPPTESGAPPADAGTPASGSHDAAADTHSEASTADATAD
jgi:hypothetical protein